MGLQCPVVQAIQMTGDSIVLTGELNMNQHNLNLSNLVIPFSSFVDHDMLMCYHWGLGIQGIHMHMAQHRPDYHFVRLLSSLNHFIREGMMWKVTTILVAMRLMRVEMQITLKLSRTSNKTLSAVNPILKRTWNPFWEILLICMDVTQM